MVRQVHAVLFSAGFNFKNKLVTRNAAAAYLVLRHHDRSYPYGFPHMPFLIFHLNGMIQRLPLPIDFTTNVDLRRSCRTSPSVTVWGASLMYSLFNFSYTLSMVGRHFGF